MQEKKLEHSVAIAGRGTSGLLLAQRLASLGIQNCLLIGEEETVSYPLFFYSPTHRFNSQPVHSWGNVSVYFKNFTKKEKLANGKWYQLEKSSFLKYVTLSLPPTYKQIVEKVSRIDVQENAIQVITPSHTFSCYQVFDSTTITTAQHGHIYQPATIGNSFFVTLKEPVLDPTTLILTDTRNLPPETFAFVAATSTNTATIQICYPRNIRSVRLSEEVLAKYVEKTFHTTIQSLKKQFNASLMNHPVVPTPQSSQLQSIGIKAGWIGVFSGFGFANIAKKIMQVTVDDTGWIVIPQANRFFLFLLQFQIPQKAPLLTKFFSKLTLKLVPLEYISSHI